MKSFQYKLRTTAVGLVTVALVAGCSTNKQASRQHPAPIVNNTETVQTTTPGSSMGGTGATYGSQAGGGQSQPMAAGQSEIVIPLQQEQVDVSKHQVNEGGVQLRKSVRTETSSQPVELRKETVTVEKVPANAPGAPQTAQNQPAQGAAALNTPFQQGEMTINLSQEQPTVSTKTVPAGSVVVRKQVTTEPLTVQTQTRKEEIQAVPIGNSPNVNISSNLTTASSGMPDQSAAGGGPSLTGQSTGASGSSAPITQLSQLTSASDPASLTGRQVNLSNAKVQQVYGDRLLSVSSDSGGTPIYVKTADSTSNIKPGQTISLNGAIKEVPQSVSDLGLDQAAAQRLQGQPFYVDATRVMLAPQQ